MILYKSGIYKYKAFKVECMDENNGLTVNYTSLVERVKESDMTHIENEEAVLVRYDNNKKILIIWIGDSGFLREIEIF